MSDPTNLMLVHAMNSVPENRRTEFQFAFQEQKKNRSTAFILSFFLGHLGVDRFYLGQVALGVLKLFTLGMLGFWWLIDLFLIMGAADTHNKNIILQLKMAYPSTVQENTAAVPEPAV